MLISKKKYGCMKRFWDVSFYGGIIGTILFSIGAILNFFNKDAEVTTSTLLIGILFYGLIPMGFGYYFRRKFAAIDENYKRVLIQKALLTLAKEKKGIVKISDFALSLEITYEEAKELIEQTVLSGLTHPEVDEDGFIYYVFPEFKD